MLIAYTFYEYPSFVSEVTERQKDMIQAHNILCGVRGEFFEPQFPVRV
jgi:hypothetical protein